MREELYDNRYRLRDLLGNGTSANVYLATDTQTAREVAIKIYDEDYLSQGEALRLFECELKAVARLGEHPNLLTYYGGSMKKGSRYLVMEVAYGETLIHYLNRRGGKLSLEETLSLFSQLLSALSHIHTKGVIHRDIKPQNIRVSSDGLLKLCDFGIAAVTDLENSASGKAVGTVFYISPEQAMGREVSPASDLYSAGVLLYEMLAGVLPFTSDKESSRDRIDEIIRKHLKEIPIRPSHYNPNIPEALEQIVLRALNKNPKARFHTADEMLRFLAIYHKTPNIVFDFDLPNDEFDSYAALPQKTDPNGFRPIVTPKKTALHIVKKEADTRDKSLTRKKLILISLVIILMIATAFAIHKTLHSLFFFEEGDRTVLTRGDLLYTVWDETAAEMLTGYDLTVEYAYSRYYPSGTIISQDPAPYAVQKVSEGNLPKITLTVSTKDAFFLMPDEIGKDYRTVKNELESRGVSVIIERDYSQTLKEGCVISTDPRADRAVLYSDTVTLTVSLGKRTAYAYVPNLIGVSYPEAREKLLQLGITPGKIEYRESDAPKGTVIFQDKAYGDKLAVDYYQVSLVISLGKPETEAPSDTESIPEHPEPPVTTINPDDTTDPDISGRKVK